jgi:tRNA threonylcarbamoyl adenosine modification protein YeaZ
MNTSAFLILDCSGTVSRVRVVGERGEFVATSSETTAHSESIGSLIKNALASAGESAANLRCLAVISGPGSFTGLRIAASHLSGMAAALKIPLVAVPLHVALLVTCLEEQVDSAIDGAYAHKRDFNLVVASSAGRSQYFLTKVAADDVMRITEEPKLCSNLGEMTIGDIPGVIEGSNATCIMTQETLYDQKLVEIINSADFNKSRIKFVNDHTVGAANLLRKCAWPVFSNVSLSQIDLNYVRPVNARTIAERLAVGGC